MFSMFLCKCSKEDNFQIIREYDLRTGKLIDISFRCAECGKEYSLEEVEVMS